tara:strand:- start:28856 stop:29521 length:666 start_codon:yes stop_codon:yes gene_type:complete
VENKTMIMDAAKIEKLFTMPDGQFMFSRWNRPIVPIVFGVDDETLMHLKTAIVTTVGLTGTKIAETDPELGANFMWFFCQDWDEILTVPDLEKLIPSIKDIIARLQTTTTKTYRVFSFEKEGGIKMCIQLVKVADETADIPIQTLAVGETYQCLALFSPHAFLEQSPIGRIEENGLVLAKPDYAALIRAAYDPVLPVATNDKTHAMRLAPRVARLIAEMQK